MNEQNNPLTKNDLAEFTEETLLPAVERIVDDKIDSKLAKHTHEMKDYIDRKIGSAKGDIIAVIKGEKERDTSFKHKVVEILSDNKLADEKDIDFLEALI